MLALPVRRLFLPIATSLLVAAPLHAQSSSDDARQERGDLLLRGGVGLNSWLGTTTRLSGGLALSNRLGFGAEWGRWVARDPYNDRQESMDGVQATAHWYVSDTTGLFLKSGGGALRMRFDGRTITTLPAAHLALGYDFGTRRAAFTLLAGATVIRDVPRAHQLLEIDDIYRSRLFELELGVRFR